MKVANIFISLFLSFFVGFQSLALYSLGESVGAFGIILAITLFMSAVLSWERPHISANFLLFFGFFGLIAGVFSIYDDLVIFAILALMWDYWFSKSLENEMEVL